MSWRFWVVYFFALLVLFVLGATLAVLVGANPYLLGSVAMGGGVLRVTWHEARR